jgi:uncharacterized protein (TIGR00251 family)
MLKYQLHFWIKPNAVRSCIHYFDLDRQAWSVSIQAPPVDDKANLALLKLLSEILCCPLKNSSIKSGHSSRRKIVLHQCAICTLEFIEERLNKNLKS